QVLLEVTSLSGQQACVKRSEVRWQPRDQGTETFAGTRFDQRADNQRVHQAVRLTGPCRRTQRGGIARGVQPGETHVPLTQQFLNLLVVPQFLPCQSRHALREQGSVRVAIQETDGG